MPCCCPSSTTSCCLVMLGIASVLCSKKGEKKIFTFFRRNSVCCTALAGKASDGTEAWLLLMAVSTETAEWRQCPQHGAEALL